MRYILPVFSVLLASTAFGAHAKKEKEYQKAWCSERNGITEYVLEDRTRVDCLTDKYAIEFDFGPKWHEAIGQVLYYAKMTGKKPGVVLILEKDSDRKYFERLKKAAKGKGIKIWQIRPEEGRAG